MKLFENSYLIFKDRCSPFIIEYICVINCILSLFYLLLTLRIDCTHKKHNVYIFMRHSYSYNLEYGKI